MEVRKISAIKENDEYRIPVMVKEISNEIASNGNYYVKATLADGEQEISANQFGATTAEEYAKQGIVAGSIVIATIKVSKGYYNILGLRLCDDPDINKGDFVKTAPINIDAAYQYILDTINLSANKNDKGESRYAGVAIYLLEKFRDQFKNSAAASSNHHDYIGGLIQHTANMVAIASSICHVYRDIDKELLICGCALHDIGKLSELSTSPIGQVDYTLAGSLLGHIYMGTKLVEQAYTNIFQRQIGPDELLLLHMISSHHGKKEWGAISVPATKEAYILHAIDMLDSRVQMYEKEYESLLPGEMSDKTSYSLRTRVYRPL